MTRQSLIQAKVKASTSLCTTRKPHFLEQSKISHLFGQNSGNQIGVFLDHQKAPNHFQKGLTYAVLLVATFPGFGDVTAITVEAPPNLQATIAVETVVETTLQDVLHVSGRVSVNENALAKIGPSISVASLR